MRFIALDVRRDFCEVAIAEGGRVRRAGRVETSPATLELFARSLAADDEVVLEATGNALAIARIIEPHVGRVVLANPKAVRNAALTAKTDKLDARTLAKLLASGFLPGVWTPDEQTRVLRRRISRRAQLVRQRTREKNQVHAIPSPGVRLPIAAAVLWRRGDGTFAPPGRSVPRHRVRARHGADSARFRARLSLCTTTGSTCKFRGLQTRDLVCAPTRSFAGLSASQAVHIL
jgi:transposase